VHWIIPTITHPLYFFSLYILPVALVLTSVPRDVFRAWLRAMLLVLPLVFISVAMVSEGGGSGIRMDFFPFYRDDAARLAALAVDAISIVLIISRLVLARRYRTEEGEYTSYLRSWSTLLWAVAPFALVITDLFSIFFYHFDFFDFNTLVFLFLGALLSWVYAAGRITMRLFRIGWSLESEPRAAHRTRVALILLAAFLALAIAAYLCLRFLPF